MSKLSDSDRSLLQLIERSPDQGEGWRTVSDSLWKIVNIFTGKNPDLFELGDQKIRLTEKGKTVLEYL